MSKPIVCEAQPVVVSLAKRINAAHDAFEASMQSAVSYAVEAGELLIQVKESLAHGEWLPWLKQNFRGERRTATRYMLLAVRIPDLEANGSRMSHLSINAALKALTKDANASGIVPEYENKPIETTNAIPSCRVVSDLSELDGETFSCIYGDPPWRYGNQATRASTDNHYPTMTVEEIEALPIGELASDRCHLWLWTTNGFLFECPRLFDAWGFEFKSSYIWCKTQIGIGNYLRNAHEMLLLAVRGGLTGAAKDVRSWDEFPRGEHSAKPESIRHEVVERVSPGPRLELFGRKTVPGWTVWGNQVSRSMFDAEAV